MHLRTKIEVLIVVFILVVVSVGSVFGVNRTITTEYDTTTTRIVNSNGNYWSVTESNLQTAIDEVGNSSGWVELGDDITITGAINLRKYMILDLGGHNVTISGNNNGFEIAPGCTLKNGNIQTTTYTGNMINIDGTQDFSLALVDKQFTTLMDLDLTNSNFNGTGIHFDASADGGKIAYVRVINVRTFRFEYGINMSCYYETGYTHWCNANQISYYTDTQSLYQIYLYRNQSATISQGPISGNIFTNLELQRVNSAPWHTWRSIFVDGNGNYFQGAIWDSAGGFRAIETSPSAQIATIYFPDLEITDVFNNGTNSRFMADEFFTMFPYYAQSTVPSLGDNCTLFWYDTDVGAGDGALYLVANSFGTTYYLNMSDTP